MKRILLSGILFLMAFVAQAQIPNAAPYCNQLYDLNYNLINTMTVGATTVNFGPAGNSSNLNSNLYYNTTVLPNLVAGTPMPISINFYDAPDAEPMYFALLIDLNQDQWFDAGSEMILSNANTINGPLPCLSGLPLTVNSNITIPNGSLNGPTRMRLVRFSDWFGIDPTIYDPFVFYDDCFSFSFNISFGCTYDFDVNVVAPVLNAAPNSLPMFNATVGTPSPNQTYIVNGSNLLGNVTVTAPTHFEVSTQAATGFSGSLTITPSGGTIPNTTIYVRYNPSVAGSHNGFITNTSNGAADQVVFVSGVGVAPIIPTLMATPTTLSPFSAFIGYPSAPQSYSLSGMYLSGNVNISAPAEYEISLTAGSGYGSSLVLTPTGQTLAATTIYVRYNPASVGTHTGMVSNWSTGSNTIDIPVTGTASVAPPPSLAIAPLTLNQFNTIVGVPSATQTISISGTYLLSNVDLTIPAPFEISLSAGSGYAQTLTLTPTAGMLAATTVYVRFNPQMPNTYTGDLVISATGVSTTTIPVSGIGLPNTPVVTLAPSALNYFLTTFGIPSAVQSIAVSGTYLIGPLYVSAPNHWQISLNATNGFGSLLQLQPTVTGSVPITTVFLRYNPSTPGNHQGYLDVSSNGAVTKSMQLNGYATPTSVGSLEEADLYVYPTQNTGTLYLSDKARGSAIQIVDFSGRVVFSQNDVKEVISLQHLHTGVYMVYLTQGDSRVVTKIVKQ